MGDLGDGWVSYEKAPRGKTCRNSQNPRLVSLLGGESLTRCWPPPDSLASLLPWDAARPQESA